MFLFCKRCGAKLEPNTKFCSKCGQTVTQQTDLDKRQDSAEINNEFEHRTNQKNEKTDNKKRPNIPVYPIIIFVAIAAVLAILAYTGKFSKGKEDISVADTQFNGNSIDELKNLMLATDSSYFIGSNENIIGDFEDLNERSMAAISSDNKDLAEDLIIEWGDWKKAASNENNIILRDLIGELDDIDISFATNDEKAKIDEYRNHLNTMIKTSEYKDFKSLKSDVETIITAVGTPAEVLSMNIKQVDASEYPLIHLYMDIENSMGEIPRDIDKNMIKVYEMVSGQESIQTVEKLVQIDQSEKMSVNLVADISGSMAGSPLSEAKSVIQEFLDVIQFSVGDEAELIVFSDGVEVYQPFTGSKRDLEYAVTSLTTGDMTSLYDALYAAVNRTATQNGAKCILAFTDGMDNNSSATPQDVIDTASRYRIPIYIVGIGDSVDTSNLNKIVDGTGGSYYNVQYIYSMQDIYESIFREQKEMYQLDYRSSFETQMQAEHSLTLELASRKYGGGCKYSYSPNVLRTVDASFAGDEIDKAVEKYLYAFIQDMNNNEYYALKNAVPAGSSMEQIQSKFVLKNTTEYLKSYEITEKTKVNDYTYHVTSVETYDIENYQEPLHMLVQEAKYIVEKQGDGSWQVSGFVENVKFLQKLNY